MRSPTSLHVALTVLSIAACSSKHAAEGNGSAAVPKHATALDLPEAGVTGVQVMPTAFADGKNVSTEPGVFSIHWHAPRRAARVVCRVDSYNLLYVDRGGDATNAPAGDHDMLYRADPFTVKPSVCELRFGDEQGHTVARACYRDAKLTAGACPELPPPAMPRWPDGSLMGVAVERASVRGIPDPQGAIKSVSVKALFTLAAALGDRKASFDLTCDGVTSTPDPGEGFVPLSQLSDGESLYTWELAFFMTQPLASASPSACELHVTTKRPGDPTPRALGTFCITASATTPGACPKR